MGYTRTSLQSLAAFVFSNEVQAEGVAERRVKERGGFTYRLLGVAVGALIVAAAFATN